MSTCGLHQSPSLTFCPTPEITCVFPHPLCLVWRLLLRRFLSAELLGTLVRRTPPRASSCTCSVRSEARRYCLVASDRSVRVAMASDRPVRRLHLVPLQEYHGWTSATWASLCQTAGDLFAAVMIKLMALYGPGAQHREPPGETGVRRSKCVEQAQASWRHFRAKQREITS